MNAANYTYVRVNTDNGEIWAAATRFDVAVGDVVVVPLEMPMQDFHSETLDRTFPVIYFTSQILREGETLSEEDLISHCRELIAGYKLPKSVTFRDEPMPLSGAGKVLKTELRKPYWEGRDRQVN